MVRQARLILLILAGLGAAVFAAPLPAQDGDPQLRLLEVDASQFPTVRVTLLTKDATGAPVPDLSQITLQENGVPVDDVSFANVPHGVDITFVLDANQGFNEVDDESGLSRAQKVRDSIQRFAQFYMDPEGRDRVSIIVPDADGQSGRFLLQDATRPGEVSDAIAAYDPGPLRPTPLNAMLTLGLEEMGARSAAERFRALLLFSDSRRLPEQLSYPLLTAQANDSDTGIYVAILGAEADAQEIDNARRLFEPTRASYLHMPRAEDIDPLYEMWWEQGNPMQLIYRSPQRQSGENQIAVSLGPAVATAVYDVQLAPPEITLQPAEVSVRRVGVAPDSALTDLQPAVWPFILEVAWPDDLPRRLAEVRLLVDGREQTLDIALPDIPVTSLPFSWDMSAQDEGTGTLRVEVTDELGFAATSAEVPLEVSVQRPLPPTTVPTAVPTAIPETLPVPLPEIPSAYLLGGTALLGLLLLGLLWRARARRRRARALQKPLEGQDVLAAQTEHEAGEVVLLPRLEPVSGMPTGALALDGENMTIGRAAGAVQIVLPDKSVSPLHARIRRQGRSYWLLDEGSAEGTYLNYERLGLAPSALQAGDIVQFGALTYAFQLRSPAEIEDLAARSQRVAVVLDMDGLMVDTEPLARRAWDEVLGEEGLAPLADDEYNQLIGRRLQETAEFLVAAYALSVAPGELAERKTAAFTRIRAEHIPVMPGLEQLLAELARQEIPWGVATSSPRQVAEDILEQIGVAASCRAIAGGDEVAQGKPAPDVYLLAAERLDVPPRRCLALDDTDVGCRAACAAGMLTIAIPTASPTPAEFACAEALRPSLEAVLGELDQRLEELRQR